MTTDFQSRIQELSARASATHDPEKLHAVFEELRAALREHVALVRELSRISLSSIEKKAQRHAPEIDSDKAA
jgi:hypothetical protein